MLFPGRKWAIGPDDRDNWFSSVFLHWVCVRVKVDMFILSHFKPQLLDFREQILFLRQLNILY